MARLNAEDLARLTELCREVSETIDHRGDFRLRTLLLMLCMELEKERARGDAAEDDDGE